MVNYDMQIITLRSYYSVVCLLVALYPSVHCSRKQIKAMANPIIVEGETGSTLFLPCDVTPPPRDTVAVILWYRDRRQEAVYTYDARNTSLAFRQNTPLDPSLHSRASFRPQPPAGLTISDSIPADAGLYQCRVDFAISPSKTTFLKVMIVELPHAIHLEDDRGGVITLTHNATLGEPLKTTCVVRGGNPPPQIWWTVNRRPQEQPRFTHRKDITRSNFVIPKLERIHHNSQIGCIASSTNTSSSLEDSFILKLFMPPTQVIVNTERSHAQAGHRYRVLCEVRGAYPNATVTWTIARKGRHTEVVKESTGRSRGRWWMEQVAGHADDGAQIGCSAATPAMPHVAVQNSTTLSVHYAPRLKLGLGEHMKPAEIVEGIDVYFICSVEANPPVYKKTWFIGDKEITHNASARILVSDDHLVIQKVSRKWTGKFTCRASNVVGDAASNVLQVTVRFAPICSESSHAIFEAALGEEVFLPCLVEAFPTNVTFYWTFSNSVTQKRMSQEWVSWKGLQSFLEYRTESLQDYGTLQCWAANNAGQQQEPCTLSLRPAGAPSPPSNCSVSNQTWDTLEVTCFPPKLGFSKFISKKELPVKPESEKGRALGIGTKKDEGWNPNGNDILYLITVFERGRMNVVHNQTSATGTFLIKGLSSGLDYLITVYRFNSRGRSSEITLEALTLRAAENRMRNDGRISHNGQPISSWIATTVGAIIGVLVAVVAIGAALVMALRKGSNPNVAMHQKKGVELSPKGTPDLLEQKNRFSSASSSYNVYACDGQESSTSLKKSASAHCSKSGSTTPSPPPKNSPPSQLQARDLQAQIQKMPQPLTTPYPPQQSTMPRPRSGNGSSDCGAYSSRTKSRYKSSAPEDPSRSSTGADESDDLEFSYVRSSSTFDMERESFL